MTGNKRIVVALGGNALGETPAEQLQLTRNTAAVIADLIADGNEVIIAHGNGPQIGMINLGLSSAAEAGVIKAEMPFPECCAMTQGYIGYHLQTSLQNELSSRGIKKSVAALITQIEVDPADPAFRNPTKPIGAYYPAEQAALLTARGYIMRENRRGFRRVVPSPEPRSIVEVDAVRTLAESGCTVITVGGGGIPVIRKGNELQGVAAVIDKDYAAEKLAELVNADLLLILTAVEYVSIGYGTPQQQSLAHLTVEEAKHYAEAGEFGSGSMLPKVNAAARFAATGKTAVIGSLAKAADAAQGRSGTVITKE